MTLFKKTREIRAKDGTLHFIRFAIIKTKWFGVYIHRIYQADKDPFCHTHPWNFFGVILKGGYVEKVLERNNEIEILDEDHYVSYEKDKRPLAMSWGSRTYLHKIERLLAPVTTTLFFSFGKSKEWGYLTHEGYVSSTEYRANKEKYNEATK